jgi:Protein of unknown function (DUF3289)
LSAAKAVGTEGATPQYFDHIYSLLKLKTMENMREYWAREAEMMRDKSGVLGDSKSSIPKVAVSVKFPFYFDRYKLKSMNIAMTGIADDMCYGNGLDLTRHFRYTQEEVAGLGNLMQTNTMVSSNGNLWQALKTMIADLFSIGELEEVALRMVDKFKKSDGGEFSDDVLTQEVVRHPSTVAFCERLDIGIQERLRQNKGDISKLENNTISRLSANYGRPTFSTLSDTFAGGLTICINDTWAYEIFITNFIWNSELDYTVSYKVILYDHFGLDLPDLQVNTYYVLAGFRAWFVLQHLRSFQPFITRVEFDKTLKGNVRIGKAELEKAKKDKKTTPFRTEPGKL